MGWFSRNAVAGKGYKYGAEFLAMVSNASFDPKLVFGSPYHLSFLFRFLAHRVATDFRAVCSQDDYARGIEKAILNLQSDIHPHGEFETHKTLSLFDGPEARQGVDHADLIWDAMQGDAASIELLTRMLEKEVLSNTNSLNGCAEIFPESGVESRNVSLAALMHLFIRRSP